MYSFVDPYRNNKTAEQVIRYIKQLAGEDKYRIVHICGTHEDAIMKNGIRSLLPKNVEVLMGPGCPVCTVAPNRIDYMIKLAEEGHVVTTFGDMMRVPAGCKCGEMLRAMIYSWDCPLFNKGCDPINPIGPCMVSHEGSCFIAARYGVDEL